MRPPAHQHDVIYRICKRRCMVLRNVRYVLRQLFSRDLPYVSAVHEQFSLQQRQEPQYRPVHRRLADPVRAEYAQQLSLVQRERHVLEHCLSFVFSCIAEYGFIYFQHIIQDSPCSVSAQLPLSSGCDRRISRKTPSLPEPYRGP